MTSTESTAPGDVLFVGDVHLGRRPVGLDDALAVAEVPARELSPAAALENVVEEALARPPRALVFAGDLVDQDRDRFEAYPHLERAVSRLMKAGVPVFGVAGNHDGVALPRLASRVDGFRLLGAGGTWERCELPGPGRPVDLVGWSFPSHHFPTSPLDDPGLQRVLASARPGATVLGVMHCDLDATSSAYAPVRRSALEATDVAAWFLGHVHQPGNLTGARPIGYLGSLVGLDPGEPGPRGPWRVRVGGSGSSGDVTAQQVPLAPVRWELLPVRLDDDSAASEDAVHQALERAVVAHLQADPTLGDARLKLVVVRATFEGRLSHPAPVRARVAAHSPSEVFVNAGSVPVIVQRLRDATRAAVDLEVLAEEPSPVGRVARALLEMRQDAEVPLLSEARDVVQGVCRSGWELPEGEHPLPPAPELVERAAWRVLDALLDQRREVEA